MDDIRYPRLTGALCYWGHLLGDEAVALIEFVAGRIDKLPPSLQHIREPAEMVRYAIANRHRTPPVPGFAWCQMALYRKTLHQQLMSKLAS